MAVNILNLPVDILSYIFRMVSVNDLYNLMLSCKTLKILIVNDNALWRWKFRRSIVIQNRPSEGYPELSRYHLSRISHNWRLGIYRAKLLLQHKTNYMPWLKYNQDALLLTAGSQLQCHPVDRNGIPNCNKTFWKLEVPTIRRNDIRTNDISRFVWKHNFLVCGNRDGSTSLYKLCEVKKKPKFIQYIRDCHDDGHVEVSAVDVLSNDQVTYVVTASNNTTDIRFWQMNTYEDQHVVNIGSSIGVCNEEYDGVRCISLDKEGRILAIGPNGNSRPLLLDVNTKTFLNNMKEHKCRKQTVRDLQWHDDNTIVYVNHSGVLALMDVRTHGVIYNSKDPFHSTLYCVKTDGCNAIVVGSSEYSRCVLFDRRNVNHVQMYFTQRKSSPVYCLDFNSSKLITAVDRSVAILNFNIFDSSCEPKDYSHIFRALPNI